MEERGDYLQCGSAAWERGQMLHAFIPDVPAGCRSRVNASLVWGLQGPTSGLIESFAFVVPSWTGSPQTPQNV